MVTSLITAILWTVAAFLLFKVVTGKCSGIIMKKDYGVPGSYWHRTARC